MADTITIPATGSGTATPVVATDDVSGVHYQRVKITDGVADSSTHLAVLTEDAAAAGGETGLQVLGVRRDTQSSTAGTDGDWVPPQFDANGGLRTTAAGYTTVVTTLLTRAANATAYTAGDEMVDTGGAILTLTSMARFSGGSGCITGITCSISTNKTPLPQLECWIFDTTSTPQTDNTAFAPADSVVDTVLDVVPLVTSFVGDATANTGNHVLSSGQINIPFVCVGSANLYMRIVVRNAYTPGASSDTYKFRVKTLCD